MRIACATLFIAVALAAPDTVLGAELNVAGGADKRVKLSPQIHQKRSPAANVQISAGVEKAHGQLARPIVGRRVIRNSERSACAGKFQDRAPFLVPDRRDRQA